MLCPENIISDLLIVERNVRLILILNRTHRQKRSIKHERHFHIPLDDFIHTHMDHDVMFQHSFVHREIRQIFFQLLLIKFIFGNKNAEGISTDPSEHTIRWHVIS